LSSGLLIYQALRGTSHMGDDLLADSWERVAHAENKRARLIVLMLAQRKRRARHALRVAERQSMSHDALRAVDVAYLEAAYAYDMARGFLCAVPLMQSPAVELAQLEQRITQLEEQVDDLLDYPFDFEQIADGLRKDRDHARAASRRMLGMLVRRLRTASRDLRRVQKDPKAFPVEATFQYRGAFNEAHHAYEFASSILRGAQP
jgi:hypothetical protein